MINLAGFSVELALKNIVGGYPSSVDKLQLYLQNPALAKRVPAEAREEFVGRERELGLPEHAEQPPDLVRTGFRMKDGKPPPLIGAYQVKAMLQESARALYDKGSKPSIYQVARAITYGLDVIPSEIPIQGGSEGPKSQIHQVISHPRDERIKVPFSRERDSWVGGKLSFKVLILASGSAELLVPIMEDLFQTGAIFIGLGTDRGYSNGRFTVAVFEEAAASTIVEVPAWYLNPARKGVGK